jgi:hypothetical protein
MAKNKRISKHNPKGLPAPDDLQFATHWQAASKLKDFFKRLEGAKLYLSYATVLTRKKNINAALTAAGKPLLKDMPRDKKAENIKVEGIVEMMERLAKVEEEAKEGSETPAETVA